MAKWTKQPNHPYQMYQTDSTVVDAEVVIIIMESNDVISLIDDGPASYKANLRYYML